MNTITRRTALAASVTLPLLPVSAFAQPADPAVEAYRVWRAAFAAYVASFKLPDGTSCPDDDPVMNAAHQAEGRAADLLADIVPTTIAGLAAQLAFAHYAFGETSRDSDWDNLDAYRFESWADDRDGRLIRSMTAGAERMAGTQS